MMLEIFLTLANILIGFALFVLLCCLHAIPFDKGMLAIIALLLMFYGNIYWMRQPKSK